MKKTISRILWISMVVLFFVFVWMTNILLQDNYQNQAKEDILRAFRMSTYITFEDAEEMHSFAEHFDPALRITIVSLSGEVLFDTLGEVSENHLTREEIMHLETFVVRESATFGQRMMYYAEQHGDIYVRLSIPIASFTWEITRYIISLVLFMVVLLVVSYTWVFVRQKELLQSFKNAFTMFDHITKTKRMFQDIEDIAELPVVFEEVSKQVLHLIEDIQIEKEKSLFILNALNYGVVVLDSSMQVMLLNDAAKRIFKDDLSSIKDADVNLFLPYPVLRKGILDASFHSKEQTLEFALENKTYQASFFVIDGAWAKGNKQLNGVLLVVMDVSLVRLLDKQKREFFANASHELKSPLTSIIGFMEMWEQGIIKTEEQTDIVGKTLQEAKRMNALVSEMLLLSNLETLKETNNKENIALDAIIQNIVESLSPQMKAKNIKVHMDLSPVTIFAAKEHMYHIFRNLIDNAVLYNVEHGEIEIVLCLMQNKICFTCRDTGIGIAPKDQERIFERFYRVDKARSKQLGGTGLGLAIVKHTLSLYQGRIEVESKVGNYTKFTICLPS